jgi:xanthine dehydrogenase YagS FAD-binding subunit
MYMWNGITGGLRGRTDASCIILEGKTLDEATAAATADLILKDAKPLEHNAYKAPMAHALIRRTLLKLKDAE